MPSTNTNDERRQYFRIKNKILMSFQIAEKDNLEPLPDASAYESKGKMAVLGRIGQIQEMNDDFVQDSASLQPIVKQHIEEINQQLACLSQSLLKTIAASYRDLMEVDISGGGLRFESSEKIDKGQKLHLDIILVPEFHNISVIGKVVDCDQSQNEKDQAVYLIAVEFTKIMEADRDSIIGHIFKTQSKQLRECKENEK